MEQKAAALVAADFDLPAGDGFVAAGANAPVIQRGPFPARVGGAQNVETIFGRKGLLHETTKRARENLAIGRAAEPRLIQIPTNVAEYLEHVPEHVVPLRRIRSGARIRRRR